MQYDFSSYPKSNYYEDSVFARLAGNLISLNDKRHNIKYHEQKIGWYLEYLQLQFKPDFPDFTTL